MEILIITFSKGINPGTYMQALGVKKAMEKAFNNSVIKFLNFPVYKKHSIKNSTKVSKSISSLFFQKAYALFRLIKYSIRYKENFKLTSKVIDLFNYNINEIKSYFESFDLIVIGSDTILEEAVINNTVGLNWLPDVIKTKKVFFAASASPAKFNIDVSLQKILRKNVLDFQFIGLRDELTVNLFENKIEIPKSNLYKQPDPSFFLDVDSFKVSKRVIRKIKNRNVALYNFNSNFPYRKELAESLHKKGYILASTFYNPYVDIQLGTLNAEEWAAVFKYYALVVTERFHDTLFALRNNIPVIAVDWDVNRFSNQKDSKTFRILEDYSLTNLHYNATSITDIDIIISDLDNNLSKFNKELVSDFNQRYIEKSNELLLLLKEKVL